MVIGLKWKSKEVSLLFDSAPNGMDTVGGLFDPVIERGSKMFRDGVRGVMVATMGKTVEDAAIDKVIATSPPELVLEYLEEYLPEEICDHIRGFANFEELGCIEHYCRVMRERFKILEKAVSDVMLKTERDSDYKLTAEDVDGIVSSFWIDGV